MLAAFIHGIILAFGLIIPLGAQNVFVFNQGASQPNFKRVFPVILTASLCDTLLILLAVVGVSIIVLTIPNLQTVLYSIGFLFLLYMGWSIWKSDQARVSQKESAMSTKKQVLFALSVSLLNPHAILDTIGVIGTSSISYTESERVIFTAACITVSWLWFLGIAIAGKIVGNVDKDGRFLKIINRISAIMIWGVAAYMAIQLYKII
jgi:L-lysine exporter family protein LysE/ArgO